MKTVIVIHVSRAYMIKPEVTHRNSVITRGQWSEDDFMLCDTWGQLTGSHVSSHVSRHANRHGAGARVSDICFYPLHPRNNDHGSVTR